MKKIFTSILVLILIFSVGCSAEKNSEEKIFTEKVEDVEMRIKISIGEQIFYANLENNPSTQELIKKLPLEVEMNELNGNEKYFKFAENFPSDDKKISEIHEGDLMLYGSSYLVIFYKNFSTSYSYTRLGKIENPANLSEILGDGNIRVKIEK